MSSIGKERAAMALERGPVSQLELTDEDLAGLSAAQTMSTHKKAAFLRAFALRGIVLDGVEAASVARNTAYNWKDEDEWFATLYEAALEEAGDRVEAEAHRRAVQGIDEPVIFHGLPTMTEDKDTGAQRVLTVKKYSDQLLTVLLKGHKADKYRENVKTTHAFEGQTGVLVVPGSIAPDEWAKAAAAQQAKFAGNSGDEPGA